MADEPEWEWLLRDAAQRMGNQAAADAIGYSRTLVSLVLAGKYDKDTTKVEAAVRRAFAVVECPYLEARIAGTDCLQRQRSPLPASAAEPGYWHARACRSCRVGVGRAPAEQDGKAGGA